MPMMVRMYQAALVASSSLRVLVESVLFLPSTESFRRELGWVWLKASWGFHLITTEQRGPDETDFTGLRV